jgi:hypothetical protein
MKVTSGAKRHVLVYIAYQKFVKQATNGTKSCANAYLANIKTQSLAMKATTGT